VLRYLRPQTSISEWQGFGGTDTAIVEELISRFVKPNLKGIKVTYEPIPDAYDKWIINALSAGTGPDLFYVDIFWSQGLFSSGAVEPLDAYLTKSKVLQGKDIHTRAPQWIHLQGKGLWHTKRLQHTGDHLQQRHVRHSESPLSGQER